MISFLVDTVAAFFVYLLLARFHFQWLGVPFRSQIGEFVIVATNWIVRPARRVIPPLAGFWAKFYVFLAAIEAHLYWLSVLGVVTSVVGAYYYWRIVKLMYFDDPARPFDRDIGLANGAILVGASLFTVFFIAGAAPSKPSSAQRFLDAPSTLNMRPIFAPELSAIVTIVRG